MAKSGPSEERGGRGSPSTFGLNLDHSVGGLAPPAHYAIDSPLEDLFILDFDVASKIGVFKASTTDRIEHVEPRLVPTLVAAIEGHGLLNSQIPSLSATPRIASAVALGSSISAAGVSVMAVTGPCR